MRRNYSLAVWDVPTRDPGATRPAWRRKFRCQRCGTAAGRQIVRPTVDPTGHAINGYYVERVELPYFMRPLPALADGTASFGYSERLKGSTVAGRSGIHHHSPALETAGDAGRVARHSPRRFGEPMGFWSVALVGEAANRPFMISCQNRSCRHRLLVDSSPTAEVMVKIRDTRRKSAVVP